jgi:hypothetical protein
MPSSAGGPRRVGDRRGGVHEGWPGGDDFDDLARPSGADPGPEAAAALASDISSALGEPADRLKVRPDQGEMAWVVRDGRRISWFNLAAAERTGGSRRPRLVRTFAGMIRQYDELRPTIEGLVVGRRYRLHYKNDELRRIFRVKAVLRGVSAFHHADGVAGAGWTLSLEMKPAFYRPVTFDVDTSTLVDITPM